MTQRPYVHRINTGGNFCGHNPDAPRLGLIKTSTSKTRPKILTELQARVRAYYAKPNCLPSLRSANHSRTGRQQRSERREACLLMIAAILEFTDLSSLRCGVPTSTGFVSLTLNFLTQYTGLHPRRAERAMADLKTANLLTVSQPRQMLDDGSYRGLAAVKAVHKLLFTAFGLGVQLRHERARAAKRLAKKAERAKGTLTSWARNALMFGSTGKGRRFASASKARSQVDSETYQRARMELLVALKQRHPEKSADALRAEADRILEERMKA